MGILAESLPNENNRQLAQPKYRRPLNKGQQNVLIELYRLRFATSRGLAAVLNKSSPKSIQDRLKTLEEQGLIGKRYDKSYRLIGKPAAYYLTPEGARVIITFRNILMQTTEIKNLYKNKTVSLDYIDHCLLIGDIVRKLYSLSGEYSKFYIYTKHVLSGYEDVPSWKPDLMIVAQEYSTSASRICYLDVWDGSKPFFVSSRKIENYINFLKQKSFTDIIVPIIIGVCKDAASQKKLNRRMNKMLEASHYSFYPATTLISDLTSLESLHARIFNRITAYKKPSITRFGGIDYEDDEQ